jgi:hypothetical protein
MWTFDRYQRWVEQQRDWVRPAAPAVGVSEQDGVIRPAAVRVSAPPGATRRPAARAPVRKQDGPEEITIDEDLDLEDIAELARRIERRTPE